MTSSRTAALVEAAGLNTSKIPWASFQLPISFGIPLPPTILLPEFPGQFGTTFRVFPFKYFQMHPMGILPASHLRRHPVFSYYFASGTPPVSLVRHLACFLSNASHGHHSSFPSPQQFRTTFRVFLFKCFNGNQ